MKSDKIKVLFCTPSPSNKGGITIWAKAIIEYFKYTNIDDIELVHMPMDRSVSLTYLHSSPKRFLYAIKDYYSFPFRLYKALSQQNYKVAHMATVGGKWGSIRDLFFLSICQICKVKAIVHYHRSLSKKEIGWNIETFIIRHSYRVIVLNDVTLNSITSEKYKNVIKIPNPLPCSLSDRKDEIQRDSHSLIFVGHVVPTKGIFELLDAVKEIGDITIDIYGPLDLGIYKIIKDRLNTRPIKGQIKFHGLQTPERIYEAMRYSSLFVLPTYTEGFPMVILEAMACGCPIISTPVGAIKEMLTINNKVAGYLVPPKDTKQLYTTICYCLNHNKEALNKAYWAKEKVYSTYRPDIVIHQLINLWKS
jgi:glycosyltransferase involved in cell wall biosynthesis